ncbi:MAG: hypothetical protein ACTSSM_12905 [Promethearchaeota archaeon]
MTERDVSLEKKGLLTYVIIFIVILIVGLTLITNLCNNIYCHFNLRINIACSWL